ncbi:DUF6318 family protein [Blastococcus sp. SYSU DS0619]
MRDHRGGLVRTTLGCLVAGSLLLTGCAEKQEASTSLPTTSAPTTEALPPLGPADFPVPAEARTKDAAGAEAFLRYWIELSNRQQVALDGEPLRALGRDCQECLRIAQNFDEVATAGQQYEGGELTVNALATPYIEGSRAVISFSARQEAVRLVDQQGNVVDPGLELKPDLASGITLNWSPELESWLVEAVNFG